MFHHIYNVYILHLKLVKPLYFSPLYPSPLILVISAGLNAPYSHLYGKYISHIHLRLCLNSVTLDQHFQICIVLLQCLISHLL
jgi:hypothetical protein